MARDPHELTGVVLFEGRSRAALEERMTARIEMSEYKLTAVFRGELNAAITSQTRSLIYSNLGITVTLAATFLAALKLA